jgi:hypothetical protein
MDAQARLELQRAINSRAALNNDGLCVALRLLQTEPEVPNEFTLYARDCEEGDSNVCPLHTASSLTAS